MGRIIRLQIAKLPEGVYLATSEDVQGLLAQGRTVSQTVEIARDVARKLLELQQGSEPAPELESPGDSFELPLVVSLSPHMGRLAGFRYREVVNRLRRLGFEFRRHAAGLERRTFYLLSRGKRSGPWSWSDS